MWVSTFEKKICSIPFLNTFIIYQTIKLIKLTNRSHALTVTIDKHWTTDTDVAYSCLLEMC